MSPSDLAPWTDPVTQIEYTSNASINLILGIEADCPPDGNEYWRMGYSYPVQLTQWALASSSGHPVLLRFLETLSHDLQDIATDHGGDLRSPGALGELRRLGPLRLTGPVAVTVAAQSWLDTQGGLRWNALTGLHDGGRSKLVEDVLILPITGFRYVICCFHFELRRGFLLTSPQVLGEAATVIWEASQSRILLRASGTKPKAPGAPSTSRLSMGNFAVHCLPCAESGPRQIRTRKGLKDG